MDQQRHKTQLPYQGVSANPVRSGVTGRNATARSAPSPAASPAGARPASGTACRRRCKSRPARRAPWTGSRITSMAPWSDRLPGHGLLRIARVLRTAVQSRVTRHASRRAVLPGLADEVEGVAALDLHAATGPRAPARHVLLAVGAPLDGHEEVVA